MSETGPVGTSPARGLAAAKLMGYGLAAAGAALFSTKAIFIKLAYLEAANAPLMLALLMIMGLAFFLAGGAIAYRTHRLAGKPLPRGGIVAGAMLNGFIGYYIS